VTLAADKLLSGYKEMATVVLTDPSVW